ncbi:MAG: glutathione S-transferase C-terminal domain-containing protein, partial [Pseudomonadota bacterium]|nr:glutathione S-transferase C-terminal domain-containing protein [Pseudomonadota bacterium]MEC8169090.1 glutathione S-transferase C-terminal domain-containing protein [Pseudomonadota bacterium]
DRKFICGDEYTIADIAIAPWYGSLVLRNIYNAAEFLDVASYENVVRWATEVSEREAYKRGSRVNRSPDQLKDNAILERHDASDLD